MNNFQNVYNTHEYHVAKELLQYYFVSEGDKNIVKVVQYQYVKDFADRLYLIWDLVTMTWILGLFQMKRYLIIKISIKFFIRYLIPYRGYLMLTEILFCWLEEAIANRNISINVGFPAPRNAVPDLVKMPIGELAFIGGS